MSKLLDHADIVPPVVTVEKGDGWSVTASSWKAWRESAYLHMRRSCPGCDGEREQHWLILGDANHKSVWGSTPCNKCNGKGWVLP